jgi:hypothetical protein
VYLGGCGLVCVARRQECVVHILRQDRVNLAAHPDTHIHRRLVSREHFDTQYMYTKRQRYRHKNTHAHIHTRGLRPWGPGSPSDVNLCLCLSVFVFNYATQSASLSLCAHAELGV